MNDKKRILFIGPNFMGYEKAIKDTLEQKGYTVDYYDDRPSNNFWTKAIIRINKQLYKYKIDKYYNYIWNEIKELDYKYFFSLNIEAMPLWFIKRLRANFNSTFFIFYSWDSIANKKNNIYYLEFFDKVLSFDENDCKKYPQIIFRPLFYINDYKKISTTKDYKYDFCFIGTAHSDRYVLIEKLKSQIIKLKASYFWFLYLNSKKLYLWNKITNPCFKNASIKDFKYKPLNPKDVLNYISQSKIIIDIQHPKQTGLTMRTIEMIGAKKKLITTNINIKYYNFYKPENIYIIDRSNPIINTDFIKQEYKEIDNEIYDKYSIDFWIDDIFNKNQKYNQEFIKHK